jgi:chromosome partitioning protein
MADVYTVLSEKGGVGKTAWACHLAWAGQDQGDSVLLADLDTQGNASQRLTGNMLISRKRKGGAEQIWLNDDPSSWALSKGLGDRISILHGHKGLEGLDKKNTEYLEASLAMRARIKALPFDRVVFDTPPSIGLRVAAPLFWSDLAIVVIEPSAEAIAGLGDTIETVKAAQRHNPRLKWRLLINCVVKSSRVQSEIRNQLAAVYGRETIAEIARRQPVADALGQHTAVWNSSARDKALKTQWREVATNIINHKV